MKQLLKYLYQNEEPGQMYVPTANTDFANSGHVTLLHVNSVNPGIIATDTGERWDTPRKSIMRIAIPKNDSHPPGPACC